MAKERIVPINEVGSVSNKIDVQLHFPSYVATDRIVFSVGKAERLLKAGNINRLTIQDRDSDVVQSRIGVMAGDIVHETESDDEESDSQQEFPIFEAKRFQYDNANNSFGLIKLNMEEIEARAWDEEYWREEVGSIPAWADEVNQAITSAMAELGGVHVINARYSLRKIIGTGLLAGLAVGTGAEIASHMSVAQALVTDACGLFGVSEAVFVTMLVKPEINFSATSLRLPTLRSVGLQVLANRSKIVQGISQK